MLRVSLPTMSPAGSAVRVAAQLAGSRGEETLWYEVQSQFAPGLFTARLDGFAVAGLLIAMERDERELVLAGPVSEKLLHNLQRQVMPVIRLVVPGTHPVTIHAECVDSNPEPSGRGVATGFSGGVDASCTVAEYAVSVVGPRFGLTHLLCCNVGSNGSATEGRNLFHRRLALMHRAESAIGLPIVGIDSNLADLLAGRFDDTVAARSISAALVLQGMLGRFLFSSSSPFARAGYRRGRGMIQTEISTVPALSTESMESVFVGAEHTRSEKLRIVLELPWIRDALNVCIYPLADGRNCSVCDKCVKTQAALEMLGELESFSRVFDINAYRRSRKRLDFLLWLPGRTDRGSIHDLYMLARSGRAKLPRLVRAVHAGWPVIGWPYRAAKAVKRLLRGGRA